MKIYLKLKNTNLKKSNNLKVDENLDTDSVTLNRIKSCNDEKNITNEKVIKKGKIYKLKNNLLYKKDIDHVIEKVDNVDKLDENNKNDVIKRRNGYVNNKKKFPASYYVLFFFMVGLATISSKLVYGKYISNNKEEYAVFSDNDESKIETVVNDNFEDDSKTETLQNNNSNNLDTRISNQSSIKSSSVTNKIQNTIETVAKNNSEEYIIFRKPVEGEISKIFSSDKLIYSKTLDMWKTHDGIDIKCDIGTKVYSAERGKIIKIYNDAFYGYTIVIDHGQGYKTSYSNLDENVCVKVGQSIKKGTLIGNVGSTSIGESKDEPHLHFMLYENDKIADPTSIFK